MTKPNPFGGAAASGTATAPKPPAKKAPPGRPTPRPADSGLAEDAIEEPDTLSPADAADPFADPSGLSDYKFTDFLGELLLVKPDPASVGETMKTRISDTTEIVRCDVIRLENDNELVEDSLVFQTVLLRTFKKVAQGPNNWTIGRLEMGDAKNGRSAPYIFSKATDEEKKHALEVAKELKLRL